MIRKIALAITAGLSAFFYFAFYVQYFQWRDCFNELGRCYDSESGIVYLEQAGIVWMSLALLMSGISLLLLWRLARQSKWGS